MLLVLVANIYAAPVPLSVILSAYKSIACTVVLFKRDSMETISLVSHNIKRSLSKGLLY